MVAGCGVTTGCGATILVLLLDICGIKFQRLEPLLGSGFDEVGRRVSFKVGRRDYLCKGGVHVP